MHRNSIMLGLNTSIFVLGILWRYHKGMAPVFLLGESCTEKPGGVAKESDMAE